MKITFTYTICWWRDGRAQGSESTAVTGSFVLLLLAMHPDVQVRTADFVIRVSAVAEG